MINPQSAKPKLPEGYRLLHVPDLDSTSEEAKRQARDGASAGLWIWADEQSQGRGRHGRTWVSNPGNLYASLLLYPACDLARVPELSFVAAVAAAKTISHFIKGAEVACKWPNDILVNGAKVAGILLESESSGQPQKPYVIIGIGINVAHHPDLADYPATALSKHTGDVDVITVFEILMAKLHEAVCRWHEDGFGPVKSEWLNRAHGKGEKVAIKSGDDVLNGIFTGLGENGALLLEDDSGGLHEIVSGTILRDDS